jgi:hypothetical protein
VFIFRRTGIYLDVFRIERLYLIGFAGMAKSLGGPGSENCLIILKILMAYWGPVLSVMDAGGRLFMWRYE